MVKSYNNDFSNKEDRKTVKSFPAACTPEMRLIFVQAVYCR